MNTGNYQTENNMERQRLCLVLRYHVSIFVIWSRTYFMTAELQAGNRSGNFSNMFHGC
jgi:hypothetical protein